jgi:1-pyrroline-5-carboxylate dehydrogenase
VLAPFNFPHALAAGPISGALVTGNTVVFKPASATALSGYALYMALIDGGVPAEVLHFVTGGGREVGEPLVKHPNVDGAVFTGSKEVGMDLYNSFGVNFPKPILTEMGGKNPAIVTAKADLGKAVEGVARSAFGFSGQKCSACSRVYVERPVYDEFMERLVARTKELVVGNPVDRSVFVGPVIDDSAVSRFEEAVQLARSGTVRVGGGRPSDPALANGTFVEPTIVDGLPLEHELFHRELFLPFLAVGAVDSLDEALTAANDTEYGLTAGIFTADEAEIDRFFNTIEAGVVYANRNVGPYYVMQFLREQSRTVVVDEGESSTVVKKAGE